MKLSFVSFFLFIQINSTAQTILTKVEKSNFKQTPTYHEITAWWSMMDSRFGQVKMLTMGPTDANHPLHLILVSNDKDFEITGMRKKNKRILLINNGIHPGEPDGIDASMLLVRDIAIGKFRLPNNIVLAIIPVYNIGGCLNRSSSYRVDQNGPEEFGFRGNSQNLDLNRDFIKCDSREARSFAEIFHYLDPDVFIDNHVSNGADYQHTMTLVVSQHNKLGGAMGEFMNRKFEPALYPLMKQKGYDLVPYVNSFADSPENGWPEFYDSPRYSSGYAALWHTFAFMPETHMLKNYEQRVKSTYALMQSFIEFTSTNSEEIKSVRDKQKEIVRSAQEFPLSWTLNRNIFSSITFKGYEASRKPSSVSGLTRLFYDRNKPFEKTVKFYNNYHPKNSAKKPKAYIIPQGWWKVIELLKLNKVQMQTFIRDTAIEVEVCRVEDFKTSPRQFEMHHVNTDVQISSERQTINFRKGDYYIPMNQAANRFLIETLEPQADDSYFAWNFFDAILGQKEGYSNYVFEETAAQYLEKNPDIAAKLQLRRSTDTAFAKSSAAQLDFVYKNSPYHEPAHMRYPVYRAR